jgi:hypothetical protein
MWTVPHIREKILDPEGEFIGVEICYAVNKDEQRIDVLRISGPDV